MYAHFYNLSENPFNLTPDPKFHYINESTREALASILYGIKSRKGFLTLIGEAGTGKTTLLRRIVDEIEGETRIVMVFNPGVSFDELLEYLCMELGIRAEARGRLHLLERLNAFLLEQLTEGRNVVVIIDEAQTLDDGVLEELRLLSNLETSKEKILQILLSGQPELDEKLRRPNLRQLRQRISVRATLKPMRSDEIRAYVETRLRSAGSQKAELFTATALLRCWQASQGIPRVINVICDNAMMVAFAEGSERITASVMNAAIRDLDGQTLAQAWGRTLTDTLRMPMVRYGAGGAALLLAAFVFGRGGGEGWSLPRLVASPAPPVVASVPTADRPRLARDPERREERIKRPRRELVNEGVPESAAPPERALPTVAPMVETPVAAAPSPASASAAVPGPAPERPAAPVAASPVPSAVPPPPSPDAPMPSQAVAPAYPPALPGDDFGDSAPMYAPGPLPGDPLPPADAMADSLRRAEAQARAAAARLYPDGGRAEVPPPQGGDRPVPAAQAPPVVPSPAPRPEMLPSLAPPPPELASGLESVAALSGRDVPVPRAGGRPVVGRRVRVTRGDTVWAIAMQYYGTVDSSALAEIFRHNPGIKNVRQLPVGSDVFVPFLSPEQMVGTSPGGGYQVLVAEGVDAAAIDQAASWAAARLPEAELQSSSKGRGTPVRILHVKGFEQREAALEAARALLGSGS